jgi:uncharacterized protein YggE
MRNVWVLGATAAIAGFLVAGSAAAAQSQRPFPIISVTGEGTISVAPDLAQINAGINTEGKTSREAAEANAKAMTAVIAAARQAGIAEKDIGTARYNIQPVYQTRGREGREGPPQIAGYRASNMVQVKIRDVNKVGEVVDQLVAAGANNVSGVEFMVSDQQKVLDQARLAAFAEAKRKADLYAKAAGAQAGRVVSISEQEAEAPRPMVMARAAPQAGAAPTSPTNPGEETIRVQISVTFELSQ